MAKYTDGILGGFSGKVGPVVGATWRGTNVVRSAPSEIDTPPSSAQQRQRDRFSFAIKLLNPIKGLLNQTFGADYGDKTRFNWATSYYLKHAIRTTADGLEWIYPKMLMSKGELQGLEAPNLTVVSPSTLNLSWTDNSEQGLANASDGLLVVLYSPAMQRFDYAFDLAQRSDTQADIALQSDFQGSEVIVWASFVCYADAMIATSTYVGRFNV